MLTLADSRRVGQATVYRDVSWADGSRALTSRFYVLPDEPALAATDHCAGYTFYRYRGAAGSDEDGGLLVATVRLPVPEGIAYAVRAAYGLPAGTDVVLARPPVSAGAARVSLAGENAAGEFVTSVSCASDTSSGGVSLVVVLTRDGAALVDQAMDQGLAAVHIELDLLLDFVLDDLELTVWCDTRAADQVARDLAAAGQGGPAALTAELTARHLAGTTLLTTRSLSADEQAAVDALSVQLVQSAVLPRLLAPDGSPRQQATELDQRAGLILTMSAPGVLPVTRTANLLLPDGPANTVSSDLGAVGLRRLVRVTAVGDLAAHGIEAVAVALDYSGRLPDGTVLRRTADVALRPGQLAAATALDTATADQRAVTATVAVHFADGSEPYVFDLPATDADVVDLDVDALGVLVVGVELVSPDPGEPVQAVVDLAYGQGESALSGRCVLDGAQPSSRWVAVVREAPSGYRYRVTWVRGADRTEGDWQSGEPGMLRLDPPFAAATHAVTVISAGEFDQLSALVLELQAATDQPVTTLTFTTADQTRTWTLPPDSTGYQYRTTLARPDGTHCDGPSGSTDQPVLLVRDTLRFDVTVIAALLGLGTRLSRAVVELESPDRTAVHSTLVLEAATVQARVTLRLTDPAEHVYRFRLTLCPPSQPPQVGDWQSGSSSVLVLSAPSQELS